MASNNNNNNNRQQPDRPNDMTDEINKEDGMELLDDDSDMVLKAAMIVADPFLRQIDPTTSGSHDHHTRRRTTPNHTNKSTGREDYELPTTTKTIDIWVIRPNSHHLSRNRHRPAGFERGCGSKVRRRK